MIDGSGNCVIGVFRMVCVILEDLRNDVVFLQYKSKGEKTECKKYFVI